MKLLEEYQIFSSFSHILYCTKYFIHALKQYEVPNDKIYVIRTHIVGAYIKTKDICMLNGEIGLGFIIRQTKDRKSHSDEYKLNKLGHKKYNYIIDCQTSKKSLIQLPRFNDHCLLYGENNTFNCWEYKNIYQFLRLSIKDGTSKPMIIDGKSTLLNILDKKMLIKWVW